GTSRARRDHQAKPAGRRPMKTSWIAIVTIVALLQANALALPQFDRIGIDQHLDAQIPLDLSFRDETGSTVRLADFFDGRRPVVLNLVYYKCSNLCTLVLNDTLRCMRAMPLEIGTDFQVVTVSIDPRETPELALAKKQQYIASYRRAGAESGWHFL